MDESLTRDLAEIASPAAEPNLDPLLPLNAVKGQAPSLPGSILPVLREAIVSGELAPGSRLSEAQLGRRLNVSRTPVREALIQLEREGLVVIVPHLGASVRTINAKTITDIYQVRSALETLATSLVASRITTVGKARLAEIIEEMKRVAADNDVHAYALLLDRFHLLLMRLSGNETLEQMYESLMGPIRRMRRITLKRPGRIAESLRQHLRIGEAIIAGAPVAPAYMTEHLADACEVVTEVARAIEVS